MKILNSKKGFTTNSSGSYEWIPTATSSTSTSQSTSSPNDYQFTPAKQKFDLGTFVFLPISIITGLVALFMILKEFFKKKKKK